MPCAIHAVRHPMPCAIRCRAPSDAARRPEPSTARRATSCPLRKLPGARQVVEADATNHPMIATGCALHRRRGDAPPVLFDRGRTLCGTCSVVIENIVEGASGPSAGLGPAPAAART
jgi:hypothetical protein